MSAGSQTPNNAGREKADRADKSRLRVLWIGLCLYFLIMINALRLVHRVPYQILLLGALVNFAIIVSIFVAINKVRKRMTERT